MSTNVEDGTVKSKKTAVKVGGEFGGIAGIVVVGGVVAVGIAAGAIALLRKRHTNSNRNRLDKDENREISSQKSGEICSHPNPNEHFGREEVELAEPSSENVEETEPIVEIVESLSDLDISPDWKDMNKSKEEESPRSHFSRKTSITSTSSDSEDFSEISRNNSIRDSEIDSSQMNLKEGRFYFIPIEETAGKEASSHFRECVPDNEDNEVHISSVNQSMDPKIEYEESVDSCDGLQEECEEVGSFVELGGSVAEHVGEQKLAVFGGGEGIKESGQCILDCKQTDGTGMGRVMDNGNSEHNRVGLEEDGGSLCVEQVHIPLKGVNTNVSEDLQRIDVAYEEIGSMRNYGSLKEDMCLEEKESQLQNFDSKQDIALFKEEQLEVNIRSSEVLNCHEDVIDSKKSEDYTGDFGCFTKANSRILKESEEKLCPVEELECYQNGTIGANGELLLCNEQCLQKEKFDSNIEQCLQERINSEEELEDSMVDEIHNDKQRQYEVVDSRDFEDLDHKGNASDRDENGQHEELEEPEEIFCHTPNKEETQPEPVTFKDLEGAELDVYDHQDGPKNDTVVANEEILQEEKFELNVEQCSQERADSVQLEDFKDNVAQNGEPYQRETVDSSHFGGLDCLVDEVKTGEQCQHQTIDSSDFEDLDSKGGASHSDENGQHGELEEENNHSPIKEEIQKEPVASEELEGTEIYVHDHQDGPRSDIVSANKEMLLCKEQCLQDEKFELDVEHFSQERTDSEESDDCKDNVVHKGEPYQCRRDDSSNIEDLDYKGGVCHPDDSQQEELDDLKENLYPIKEQSSSETNQSMEMECAEADMHVHQDEQNEIIFNEQNEIVCSEQFVQEEEFESNVDLCLQARPESEELKDSKVDIAPKGEQYNDETVDSKHLGTTSHHDEIDRHRESADSEENLCAIEKQCQNETAQCKELKCADVDLHVHQDGHKNEIVVADEELLLCKEQCIQVEKFESNIEQCLQERTDSEVEMENCVVVLANNGEKSQYESVNSRDFESSNYKEGGQIKEQIQQETVKEIECTADNAHIHHDGEQNSVVNANEKVLPCKEQCPQEEKLEYSVDNCLQKRTEMEELKNCKINEVHNGQQYQYDSIDSKDFEILDHKECEKHIDENCQDKEIVNSGQHFCPSKEQFQEETVKDGHRKQIVAAYEQVLLSKEQSLSEETFESHPEQWQQDMAGSEELENCEVDVAREGKQCHLEATDSREFVALGEGASHENESCQYRVHNSKDFEGFDERASHKNGSCQYEAVGLSEFEDSKGGVPFAKEQSESVRADSKEDTDQDISSESNLLLREENPKQSLETIEDMPNMNVQCEESTIDPNEKEDKEGDALICKEENQEESHDSIDSQTFVQDAHVESQGSEEVISKLEELDLTEEVVPIIRQHSQKETADSIDKLDSVEDLSLKNKLISESEVLDNLHVSGEDMSDMDVQCEESTIDSNEKEDKEGDALICKEEYQEESLDSIGSQTCVQDAHVESQESEELIGKFEKPDLTEEVVPVIQEHSQKETADSIDKLDSVKDLSLENKQYERKMSESEVVDNPHVSGDDMSDMDVQCEESTIDSNEKEDKEGDALICEEEYQEESLDTIESRGFVQDAHVESQGSAEVISTFEELDLTEEVVPIIQEHSQKETVDSIDKLDSVEDLSLKNKLISESEVLDNLLVSGEDMSDMDVQCEESTIDSNEKEDKEGDALICKEECQEESLDSIDSQTFVQDARVESQGSAEVISKFEELDLTEEVVSIIQEHSQKETADSVDKLDSDEGLSLKNKQYQRRVSESEVLDNLHTSGEECKENTIDLEELEQSENVHLSKEQCQQNIVDPEETIGLENVNQYKQSQRVDVNGKESEDSISNVLILKGLCANEIVDPKDPDNEDPQTKPKEVDANESEHSNGDTHCSEEKYQQETIDKAAKEDYKQNPEQSPELEGIHTYNSENSSTHTHCGNGEKEMNQDMSTTIVSESCKLVDASKEIQVHKESTDNETDTVMKSDSRAVANNSSVTKRVKNGCDPLHSPQLDSTAEEGKLHLAQSPRNLTTRIRIIVCLFAFVAFLFLFASKLARSSTSEYAI
ncbi:hypothetical protein SUGI_0137310 [Cryptomeria japonica]|uniref:uncharacterized protein LOC131056068 n=1 Tax=Cryptomeria japonica TaxID=3369 RepID=UPI002408A077|nr:uncharacterized protein LOC131056068 [Cryptomeria japonica]GLJ10887.1 hypothetical protein SUGI_0137310 [Cryptomeria japonica]